MDTDQFHKTMCLDDQNGETEDVEMKMMEQLTTPDNTSEAQLLQVPVNSLSTDRSEKRKQEHITSTPDHPNALESNSNITNLLPPLPSTTEDESSIHWRRQSDIRKAFARTYLKRNPNVISSLTKKAELGKETISASTIGNQSKIHNSFHPVNKLFQAPRHGTPIPKGAKKRNKTSKIPLDQNQEATEDTQQLSQGTESVKRQHRKGLDNNQKMKGARIN